MQDDIICYELWQYGYQKKRSISIRQNDLTDLESFRKNTIFENLQKTNMQIFHLYFGADTFVKLKLIVQSPGGIFQTF